MHNLISILSQRALQTPNQLAYIFLPEEKKESQITYRQLAEKSAIVASHLQSLIPEKSRALLLYPQGLDFIAAFLGCLQAGVVAVPAYPPKRNQKLSRLQAIIKDCQPKVILTTNSILKNIQARLNEILNLQQCQWLTTDSLNEVGDRWQPVSLNNNDLALLQYTSGSTGIPKGVMISHANIIANSAYIQKAFELTQESVSVTWLPSFHDMGLIDGIIQPLYTGFLGVVMSPESFLQKPILWLQAISHYRATHSGGPNLAYQLCVEKITSEQQQNLDLSSWLSAYNGSEPVRQSTLEAFVTKFQSAGFQSRQFYPCYGMAEATLMISGGKLQDKPVYFNAQAEALEKKTVREADIDTPNKIQLVGCGESWLDTKIMIVNPETCLPCDVNEVGEIWVSGASVALGYWNQEEQTAETFQAKLTNTGEEPFLRTGDLGFIRNNQLFITGRSKDLIIIWGRNHYPQDIESSVQQSHAALRSDCGAAFSIEIDNQERLVIVQEVERTYLRTLDIDEVVAAIREAVSLNHDLQTYAILLIKPASIPKTSSGKIQRFACRQGFIQGTLDVVGEWRQKLVNIEPLPLVETTMNREVIEDWLLEKLSKFLGIDSEEIDLEESIGSYGLDSSVALTLTGELGTWLNLDLEPTLFWEYPKISELIDYLWELLKQK